MRLLILLILIQIHLGLYSQNLENPQSESKTSLTQTENEQLKMICNKECQTYDLTNKNIAFAGLKVEKKSEVRIQKNPRRDRRPFGW